MLNRFIGFFQHTVKSGGRYKTVFFFLFDYSCSIIEFTEVVVEHVQNGTRATRTLTGPDQVSSESFGIRNERRISCHVMENRI